MIFFQSDFFTILATVCPFPSFVYIYISDCQRFLCTTGKQRSGAERHRRDSAPLEEVVSTSAAADDDDDDDVDDDDDDDDDSPGDDVTTRGAAAPTARDFWCHGQWRNIFALYFMFLFVLFFY